MRNVPRSGQRDSADGCSGLRIIPDLLLVDGHFILITSR